MHVLNQGLLFRQYRTQKHTQKNSRDMSNLSQPNLIKQIREYKQSRSSDLTGKGHMRFQSMPCNQLAGIQKIRDKKLCSPIILKKFENEEVPQQMTDDQNNRAITIISDLKHVAHQKRNRVYQKNLNNLNRQQSLNL